MNKKRALVTGAYGQDGAYLISHLLNDGYFVYGLKRRSASSTPWRLEELGVLGHEKLRIVDGDVTDIVSISRVIEEAQPNYIFNTAAMSQVHVSFSQPIASANINGVGVVNLLESVKSINPEIRVLNCATSELYGTLPPEQQGSDVLFHPVSPYACSKLYAFWMMRVYRDAYHMFTVNSICWNHESFLRGAEFVTRSISTSVAKIKAGKQKSLKIGNLAARRDWGHASDYTRCMIKMLLHDEACDWPVATGISHSVRDFVEMAFDVAGISNYEKYIEVDPVLFRPAEVPHLCFKPTKTMEVLDWAPTVTFEQLVKEMVDADIKRYCP